MPFSRAFLDSFLKTDAVVAHELLENVDVDAVPDVEEGAVLHMTLLPIPQHVHVHIEVQVQMVRCRLHPPHTALAVKRGPSALPPESWRTQFKAGDTAGPEQMPCHHAFERDLRCVRTPSSRPANLIRPGVVLKIGEFGERETKPAQELSLFQLISVLREDGKGRGP